jgi:hypothetical protein
MNNNSSRFIQETNESKETIYSGSLGGVLSKYFKKNWEKNWRRGQQGQGVQDFDCFFWDFLWALWWFSRFSILVQFCFCISLCFYTFLIVFVCFLCSKGDHLARSLWKTQMLYLSCWFSLVSRWHARPKAGSPMTQVSRFNRTSNESPTALVAQLDSEPPSLPHSCWCWGQTLGKADQHVTNTGDADLRSICAHLLAPTCSSNAQSQYPARTAGNNSW